MKTNYLWKPKNKTIDDSLINNFFNLLEKKKYLKNNKNFLKLWKWTNRNPDIFWSAFWDFSEIIGFKGKEIIKKNKIFSKTKFFPDSEINYAENILKKNLKL